MFANKLRLLVLIKTLYILINVSCLHFKTLKLECSVNPELIKNYSCKTVPINRYTALSYADFYLKTTIKNLTVCKTNLDFSKKDYSNRYQPFLINITENICSYFLKKRFSAYVVILGNILRNMSNLIHPCPYNGHLYIRGLKLDEKSLPLPLPLGTYRIRNKYFEGYPLKMLAMGDIYFEVLDEQFKPSPSKMKPKN